MEKAEQIEKVKQILRDNNISMSVIGCGCCVSPIVYFKYKDEIIVDCEDDFIFDTEEE